MSSEAATSVVSGQAGSTSLGAPAPAAEVALPTEQGLPETTANSFEEKEDPKFSARFAALARREKEIVMKERQASEKMKALQEYNEKLKKAKEDPLAVLDAHGWSYDALTNFILNDRQLTPEQKIAQIEKKLEEDYANREQEKLKSLEQEKLKQKDENDAIINSHKKEIEKFVKANADTYELIHAHDAFETVFELIEENYNENGEVLAIDKACEMVENWFEKEARERILKLKKFQPKAPEEVLPSEEKPRSISAPTLTNHLVAGATSTNTSNRYLSNDESKREAAKTLQRLLNERR